VNSATLAAAILLAGALL